MPRPLLTQRPGSGMLLRRFKMHPLCSSPPALSIPSCTSPLSTTAELMPRRFFGGGKMTGGVKRLTDITASLKSFEKWTLRRGTRDSLGKLLPDVHPLVWEYVAQLHRKYRALLALQELPGAAGGRAEDFLRGEVRNRLTEKPFSWIRWQQTYLTEVDETADVAKLVDEIDGIVGECETLTEAVADRSGASSEASLAPQQREELRALYEEELTNALAKLQRDHLEIILAAITRRVAASDLLGSSSRTWTIEVSGKAGGEEASLFAAELLDLIRHYAQNMHDWKVETVPEENAAGVAAPSTTKILVIGDGVYRHLRHEIGVHKVQRVPVTDHDGKMQTSTALLTMMPVLDPVAVDVREEDCKFDFVRGSGPGGQGMQSSSNCCVLTHKPSGISVKCHQTRSALGNKELALQMVAHQILARKVKEAQSEQDAAWQNQWFSGERSEKMRTYNFPQNRVTDHRIGRDFPLVTFMDGSGKLIAELHGEMNAADDLNATDVVLRRHIDAEFGSDC